MTWQARLLVLALALQAPLTAAAQKPYKPSLDEVLGNYKRADDLERKARAAVFNAQLTPNWLSGGSRFWYRAAGPDGRKAFWVVDSTSGQKAPAFDHARLAGALAKQTGKAVDKEKLPFDEIGFDQEFKTLKISVEGKRWDCDLASYSLKEGQGPVGPPGQGGQRPGRGGLGQGPQTPRTDFPSPDGKWRAELREGKLTVHPVGGPAEPYESKIEGVSSVRWTPDSRRLVAFKTIPGDRRQVHLIQSSGLDTRGRLSSRNYDQPGDKLDTFESYLVDPEAKSDTRTELEALWTGGQPWAGAPGVDWLPGGKEFLVDYAERGYGRFFVDAVDAATGKRRRIIDEDPPTFFDTTASILRILSKSNELIWRSERDGFGRLYLIDSNTGEVKNPVTPPTWIVRSVEWIDEDERRLCFSANNVDPVEDPYFIHFFTVAFDGTKLTRLTDGPGQHRVSFSPDRRSLVDTWSRVDSPPVHELRRTEDGKRLAILEQADFTEWKKLKIPFPEVFTAKGRDGNTGIWGVMLRPSNFDPRKSYPIIENIYAGPQDSFVPKSFMAWSEMQKIAELGFIVVQIDGMGTRNRGKAFHDVCWKNLADAGFPDRILWMRELAKKHPSIDLKRVGVYGTSAGGQNAAGAVLFHPEFYTAAVASCGCHDNRIDKQWWNEQWMGPMGPHYAEQSNITNAAKLKGDLLLIVGEMDTNVPPESTYRLADALIKARKDFELVVIPGAGHTSGGPHGGRKRTDFFIRKLLGAPTPNWNGIGEPPTPFSPE